MAKKKKGKKKGKDTLTVEDILQGPKDPMIEVLISARCGHECFFFTLSEKAVWRFSGLEPHVFARDTDVLIHGSECYDMSECANECWEEA